MAVTAGHPHLGQLFLKAWTSEISYRENDVAAMTTQTHEREKEADTVGPVVTGLQQP